MTAKSDELIAVLEAALRRMLREGYLDPRLLCVLQANQALAKLEELK